jgi:hypothetical protein
MWEEYTAYFIKKYDLNREQSEKAWRICDACEKQAADFVARQRTELEGAELKLRRAAGGQDVPERDLSAARDLLANLTKRLDDIYERQLKPRLEFLPTRAQRAAAEQRTKP